MTHVTRELLRARRACYYDQPDGEDRVNRLVPIDGLALPRVLALDIPAADRIWVATLPGVCPHTIVWAWLALLVERALGRVAAPDLRSLAVVPLLRRLADGEDVPQSERAAAGAWAAARSGASAAAIAAASAAAWASSAAASAGAWAAGSAARSASIDAARAADRAADRAARDAARDAEEQKQIADLQRLLAEHEAQS